MAYCQFKKCDCFAYGDREKCMLLTNTDFGGRDCPWYKNVFLLEEERVEIRRYLNERRIKGEGNVTLHLDEIRAKYKGVQT